MTTPTNKPDETMTPRRWMQWIIAESAKAQPDMPYARQARPVRAHSTNEESAQSA